MSSVRNEGYKNLAKRITGKYKIKEYCGIYKTLEIGQQFITIISGDGITLTKWHLTKNEAKNLRKDLELLGE